MRIKIDDVEQSNFYKMPKEIYNFNLKPIDRELYMLCMDNWRLSVKNNWINENGEVYFYASQIELSKQMNVDKTTIIKSFEKLIKEGLLEVEKENGKANKYFLINLEKIQPVGKNNQSENPTRPVEKSNQYQLENPTRPVGKSNPNKNNNKNYIRINNKNNIYSEVINYLNEKTNRTGRDEYKINTSKTKQLINARQKEGYVLEDFKKVIDNMCIAWEGTEFENYLRPSTLFGTKFENYLNWKLIEINKNTRNNNNNDFLVTEDGLKKFYGYE